RRERSSGTDVVRASGGRPWWASGGEAASDDRRRPAGDLGQPEGPHRHLDGAEVCQVCPICSFLRLVEGVRPEVVEHLTEAARHLTLAAKAVIDAQAESFGAPRDRLERIDVDG
ncbi:MAG TPA: hypothetical protein VHF25_11210, partial [Nitriliruptorales bacterium]|nr:hypothetical protein [Nitriliruptorales bacterium]